MLNLADAFESSLQRNLDAALASMVDGTKSAKEAFADMSKAIIADIAKIILKALILKAINGIFGTNFKLADGGAVPKLADGGAVPKFAEGGAVHGPGGPRDDIIPYKTAHGQNILISNTEHIIDGQTTAKFGHGLFDAFRAVGQGRAPVSVLQGVLDKVLTGRAPNPSGLRFADGGDVAGALGAGGGLSQGAGNAGAVSLSQHFHFAAPTDPRSQSQVSAAALAGAQRAMQRNG